MHIRPLSDLVRAQVWSLVLSPAIALAIMFCFVASTPATAVSPLSVELAQPTDVPMVRVSAKAQRATVEPGMNLAIGVKFEFAEQMHIWPHTPKAPKGLDLKPIPTIIEAPVDASKPGVIIGQAGARWPKPQRLTVDFGTGPLEIESYKKPTIVLIPASIAKDASPGLRTIDLTVSYQACNDSTCFPPEEVVVPVTFEIVPAGSAGPLPTDAEFTSWFASVDDALFANLPIAATAITPPAPTKSSVKDFGAFGISLAIDTKGPLGLALVMLIGFAGGMLLNFTPCVLPVIPIKLISLQQSAGSSRAKMFTTGLVTSLGVVAFWLLAGLLVALALVSGLSQLISYWWFNLAIAIVMFAMGLGMFGLFTANLPNWVYAINAGHDKPAGSFLFGIMHAVLATPCVAPLGGAAAAWATTQSWLVTISVFGAIGVGMSTPYLLLSAFPKSVNWLPRAGPGSELLKQVMGLLVLAAGVFFLGTAMLSLTSEYPYLAKVLHWWLIAILVSFAMLWMIIRVMSITPAAGKRVIFSVLGLGLASFSVVVANYFTKLEASIHAVTKQVANGQAGAWRDYDPAAYDQAVAAGKVVVLDFTAEWCLNCKVLEATVLNTDAVSSAFKTENVVTFKADLTARKAPGWDRLKAFQETGIPLLVIQGPGLAEPWKSNAYTSSQVLGVLERAKTKAASK